jgi:hypothetical protein
MGIAYWHWQLICPIINYKKTKYVNMYDWGQSYFSANEIYL